MKIISGVWRVFAFFCDIINELTEIINASTAIMVVIISLSAIVFSFDKKF